MKAISYLCLLALGALLLYGTMGLPNQGDPNAATHKDLTIVGTPVASQYYVKNAYRDTHTPNMVTAILADYRAFDTLGEEIVIAVAGLICFLLLRKPKNHV
jgi:multicomponent Na+:H+ antiporter subunit B